MKSYTTPIEAMNGIQSTLRLVLTCLVVVPATVVLSGCYQEEVIQVSVDFSYTVKRNDYSVPVEITFSNLTAGAEQYRWTFEGTAQSASTNRNPGPIIYPQEGVYIVRLEAWNDDDRQTKEITLRLYGTVAVAFQAQVALNNIAPAVVTIAHQTQGGTAWHWKFPAGEPASFSGYTPPDVLYTTAGDHIITLVVENGTETDSLSHTIALQPPLSAAFDLIPSFDDDDYEAPLDAVLANHTTSGIGWQWLATGGEISNVTAAAPSIHFSTPGTYTVTLTATSGKETQSTTRQIVVKPNSGLRTLTGVKLGINTAHGTTGSFYSTTLRRVITANDHDSLGRYADIAFFGLNASFTYNRFVSPDSVQQYTFPAIDQAQTTDFINAQELCACNAALTDADFASMTTDAPLKDLTIRSTAAGLTPFDHTQAPRIVLFQTADGRKGAIRINVFHSAATQSYILTDIKVQKQ